MRRIKSFVPNESRPSSTRANPIKATGGAGFPLLLPDTFYTAAQRRIPGCTLLTTNAPELIYSMQNPSEHAPAALQKPNRIWKTHALACFCSKWIHCCTFSFTQHKVTQAEPNRSVIPLLNICDLMSSRAGNKKKIAKALSSSRKFLTGCKSWRILQGSLIRVWSWLSHKHQPHADHGSLKPVGVVLWWPWMSAWTQSIITSLERWCCNMLKPQRPGIHGVIEHPRLHVRLHSG